MRAVIYTRVSSDPNGTLRSVESQEEECRKVAAREGWTVGPIFVDNHRGASRHSRKERPAYGELRQYLAAGHADVLLLWEGSRAQRDLRDYLNLRDLCAERGVRYCYSGRTYDLTRTDDRFSTGLDALLAEREADVTRDRVLRGKRTAAAAGRPAGKLLFGYTRTYDERGEFVAQVIREDQADVAREAARRVAAGESCYSVAQDFNVRDIPTPRREPLLAKADRLTEDAERNEEQREELLKQAAAVRAEAIALRWDLTQIRRLVTNPAYVAQRVHQGRVVGPGAWPAILKEKTYNECVDRISDPARRTQRDSTVKHLLSGAAKCGPCGGRMRVQKNRGFFAYLCTAGFCVSCKTGPLEDFVTEMVVARLSMPDILELLAGPGDDDTAAAGQEAEELQERLNGFYDQAADNKITPEGMARIEARLLPQIADAKRRSRVVGVPPLVRKVAGPDAAKRWEELTIGQRRELVSILVDLKVGRTVQGSRFNPLRLGESRWVGDSRTWGEIWAAEGLA